MVTIVDYGMGNLGSIKNMLKKIGSPAEIVADPKALERAEKLILPGVGAFDRAMENLRQRGLLDTLHYAVKEKNTPVLGICLGMQLLCQSSEEGKLPGLCWLEATVKRFNFSNAPHLKIPHMGWNQIVWPKTHHLFKDMPELPPRFYFVHSFHVHAAHPQDVLAETFYGYPFASAIGANNIWGVQFHPEKSHKFGMQLLKNFVEY